MTEPVDSLNSFRAPRYSLETSQRSAIEYGKRIKAKLTNR